MELHFPEPIPPLILQTQRGELTVHRTMGGPNHPWAPYEGRVLIGPPQPEALLPDGRPEEELAWTVSDYWVTEAFNEAGEEVQLTPEEYQRAVS